MKHQWPFLWQVPTLKVSQHFSRKDAWAPPTSTASKVVRTEPRNLAHRLLLKPFTLTKEKSIPKEKI